MYKTVDVETPKRSIGEIIKDLEILRLAPNDLKIEKMYKHVVKMLPFLIKYVPELDKTQRMCDKVILQNGAILMLIPKCYKDQNICNKAVDNYTHA